jgi:hypothetical protein
MPHDKPLVFWKTFDKILNVLHTSLYSAKEVKGNVNPMSAGKEKERKFK